MATTKVGIYRSFYGPVPTDSHGQPLPRSEWPKKRPFSWVVRWFGADGNRYSRSFETRKEAERFAEDKQNDVREAKADPPPQIRLRQFYEEHQRVMRGQVAHETLEDQLRAMRMFMDHVGDERALHTLLPRDAESFVAARLGAGVKVATVNKDIRTLKRVFSLAIAPRGYLSQGQNPFGPIKQRKQSAKPIRYVTAEELQKLFVLPSATTWWKALLGLAYTTAARLGELMNLTWADVDFENNRIRIVCKERSEVVAGWEPKDHDGRVLPVPEQVARWLIDLQADAAEGCPYVFVPAWRWEHITNVRRIGSWPDERALVNNLNRRLATLRQKAGVAPFTYHDLRRSCLTSWARHLPVHVVQKLAGHSDIKTTQRYYLSVQPEDLDKARLVQAAVLVDSATDQKLTNSGPKQPPSQEKQKKPSV